MAKAKPAQTKATKKGAAAKAAAEQPAAKSKEPSKKARVLRILKKKEPQLIEDTKKILVLKGHRVSQSVTHVLQDISKLTKPNCKVFGRKNEILPFDDANSLEFLTNKNDCALFALGSHTKKRPNNLVIGRTFDGHILDMVEFGVDSHRSIDSFTGQKKAVGSKPLMIFLGDQWDSDSSYFRIMNLLLDFFRADKIEKISLKGMDHVLTCSVMDGKIHIRGYTLGYRKSGTKVPKTVLQPMGPFMDLSLRRMQLGADDLFKLSLKQPKSVKPAKVKNITDNTLGEKVGRLHLKKQNFDKMGGRRVTALRTKRGPSDFDDNEGGGGSDGDDNDD